MSDAPTFANNFPWLGSFLSAHIVVVLDSGLDWDQELRREIFEELDLAYLEKVERDANQFLLLDKLPLDEMEKISRLYINDDESVARQALNDILRHIKERRNSGL